MRNFLVPLICTMAGIAFGYWLKLGKEVPSGDPAADAPVSTALRSAVSPAEAGDAIFEDYLGGTAGKLRFYQGLEVMDEAGLESLVRQMCDPATTDWFNWGARRSVFKRFAEIDPMRALAFAKELPARQVRDDMVGQIVSHLATDDLASVTEIVREISDKWQLDSVLSALGNNRDLTEFEGFANLLIEVLPSDAPHSLTSLVRNWCRSDAVAAIRFAGAMPPGKLRRLAQSSVAQSLAASDPAAAITWMNSVEPSEKNSFASQIAREIAKRDPHLAIRYLNEFPGGDLKPVILENIAGAWHLEDPQAAGEWIGSLPMSDRLALLDRGQGSILHDDPEGYVRLLDGLPEGSQLDQLISGAARKWKRSDPAATARWLDTLPAGSSRDKARKGVVHSWAESDPAAAVAFLGEGQFGDRDTALVQSVITSWIGRDREAALAWADGQTLPEGARLGLVKGIAGSLVTTDPDGAIEYVLGLSSAAERQNASTALVSGWASKDAAAAERWIGESLGEAERPAAYGALVATLAETDLAEATRLFNEHPPDEGANGYLSGAPQIAGRWALTDPQAAADWATSIADSGSRNAAIKNVSESWARTTPRDASEWVSESFVPGPERDVAVRALAGVIVTDDPASAFMWASSMSESSNRDNYLTDIARYWRERDPAAARAGIIAAEISQERKAAMLSEFPQTQ